jgi:hypothetical protein
MQLAAEDKDYQKCRATATLLVLIGSVRSMNPGTLTSLCLA